MKKQQIKISTMTGKLKGFNAINTNTLSNNFCTKMRESDSICNECYSASMLQGVRKNCVQPWENNSQLLSTKKLDNDQLPIINAHSFRFNGHGELINGIHVFNLMQIVKKNPFTTFSLWTKRPQLVQRYIREYGKPSNLILIKSNPTINTVSFNPPKYFDKTFNNYTEDRLLDVANSIPTISAAKCTGISCMDCMICYRVLDTTTVIMEKVK